MDLHRAVHVRACLRQLQTPEHDFFASTFDRPVLCTLQQLQGLLSTQERGDRVLCSNHEDTDQIRSSLSHGPLSIHLPGTLPADNVGIGHSVMGGSFQHSGFSDRKSFSALG